MPRDIILIRYKLLYPCIVNGCSYPNKTTYLTAFIHQLEDVFIKGLPYIHTNHVLSLSLRLDYSFLSSHYHIKLIFIRITCLNCFVNPKSKIIFITYYLLFVTMCAIQQLLCLRFYFTMLKFQYKGVD